MDIRPAPQVKGYEGIFSFQKRFIQALVIALPIVVLAGAGWVYIKTRPILLGSRTVAISIREGMDASEISRELARAKLIHSESLFLFALGLSGGQPKAGAYEFAGTVRVPQIVEQILSGKPYSRERVLVIPEGWDMRDLKQYFLEKNIPGAEDLFLVTGEPASASAQHLSIKKDFDEQKFPKDISLEGYLFPDTYLVYRDDDTEVIVKKMLSNFSLSAADLLRTGREKSGRSESDILVMASLIEKEVHDERDRRIVAGILWKRKDALMRLQVDATVNYITGKKETPEKRDLAIESPYNTYRVTGLPKGAISNPGLAAIRAAIEPEKTPYFYYRTLQDGRTIFSETFEAHDRAGKPK